MFIEEPNFRVGKKNQFILTSKLVYRSTISGQVVVPEGFETDFASIPLLFQRIIPVNGNHRLPAVVHDYLYSVKGRLPSITLSRQQCDRVLLTAMEEKNVNAWRRLAMYGAVRIGGQFHW